MITAAAGTGYVVLSLAALLEASLKEDIPVLFPGLTESEAVKLFANTYLALRVACFNELDTYAGTMDLNIQDIIEDICMDPCVGSYYNNPSFGCGGYCLPKDSKQLRANYADIPENLISAIVQSNSTRKPRVVGIQVIIYEPTVTADEFDHVNVFHSPEEFKVERNLIIANRMASELAYVADKVYTRGIYARD